MSIEQTYPEFVRVFANFLHMIDEKAVRFTHADHYVNVRLPMRWPENVALLAAEHVEFSVTQALAKQVFALRADGYDQPIWIDFEERTLVVAFKDAEQAMLFKLAHGGTA